LLYLINVELRCTEPWI